MVVVDVMVALAAPLMIGISSFMSIMVAPTTPRKIVRTLMVFLLKILPVLYHVVVLEEAGVVVVLKAISVPIQ